MLVKIGEGILVPNDNITKSAIVANIVGKIRVVNNIISVKMVILHNKRIARFRFTL